MDFISVLPTTSRGNNAIWVIVDRLTKSAHFIPLKMGKKMHMLSLTKTFLIEIVSRHGQPVSVTSYRDTDSSRDSGRLYMSPCIRSFSSAQCITRRQMDCQKGPFRHWRTCSGHMCLISRLNGMKVYLSASLLITIATTRA